MLKAIINCHVDGRWLTIAKALLVDLACAHRPLRGDGQLPPARGTGIWDILRPPDDVAPPIRLQAWARDTRFLTCGPFGQSQRPAEL